MATKKSLREALNPTGSTRLDPAFVGKLLDQVESRLGPVEAKKADFEAAEQLIRVVALQRINETLTPAIQQVLDLVSRGFMIAHSGSEAIFGNGNVLTLIVPEGGERDLFTPSPFTAVTREANADDFAICRTISYVAEIGEYVGEVIAFYGDEGPHDDLVIGALAGPTVAQKAMLDLVMEALDDITAKHATVVANTATVAADKATVAADKAIAVAASADAVAAKNAAEQIAADLVSVVVLKGTWSPSSGAFPGGTGVKAGWSWIVADDGTVAGVEFNAGDRLIAIVASASTSTFAGNWFKADYTDKVSSVAGLVGAITDSGLRTALNVADGADNTAAAINAASGKTTPVDADLFGIIDSAASNVLKKLTWANVKATLQTYFDTVYQPTSSALTALASAFTPASASGPAALAFAEDTDNGSNKVTLKAPTSISSDIDVALPGTAGTLAVLSGAQTWTGAQQFARVAGAIATTSGTGFNNADGNIHTRTVAGNTTFTVSNVPSGVEFTMYVRLTYTSGTITWFSGVNWTGGSAPTLTGGKVYEIIFTTVNGGTAWQAAAGEYAA